jgi:hypothetical protein
LADDVSANINVNFDTRDALRQLRALQAQLSRFNQALTQGNLAAVNAQKGLTDQLIQSINATGKFVASQKEISTSTKSFTDALEKNKLSLKEYFRYTAAAATADTKTFTRAFAAEREVLNRARKDRVKLLQSQYIQLTNANGELVKVLQVVPKHLEMTNGKYADYATRVQMAAQRQQFLNQLLKQGSTQLLNFGKNTQWAGRQLMVGLTIPLTMMGTAASRAFMDMEQAVIKFSRVYGDMLTSTESTDKAIQNVKRLGMEFTKYGIAVKDTVELASQAAAMGLVGDALEAQVRQATRLSVLGQVEQQQALETTISLQNAFGISSEQLAQKINFLNAVENQTVLSIEDLTVAIPKAGPVVKQLGGSVEDLAFFMTAMKEGGINASEGANALKSGLASLINPSKKASEFLAGLGINIKGLVEANAGDLKGTVVGFARALDTLDPLNRARAIEQLFGKFQFARLSTLFQNVSKGGTQAARAFDLAGASVEELAILSERELAKVENAVGVKFKKTLEQLKVELVPVGKAFLEAVTPIVKFVGDILKKFNGLSDGTKKIVTVITGVLGVIAPVALMSIGLVANGIANLIKFFAMLRGGMAKLNGQNQVLGGGFDYLTQQEIENLAETNALHTSHKNLIATFNVEASAADALARAYANATSQARALAASSPGLFNVSPGVKSVTPPKVPGYKDGVFSVPGTGSGDKVPAMLEPGETVVSKDNTQKYGPLLEAIATDSVPGYRRGRVGDVTQSDIDFTRSSVVPGTTAETYILAEFKRIREMTVTELSAYAERTGVVLKDTTQESLEGVRETIIKELQSIVEEAKAAVADGAISSESEARKLVSTIGKRFDPEKGYSRMGAAFPQFDQQERRQYSHVGGGTVTNLEGLDQLVLDDKTRKGIEVLKKVGGFEDSDFRVMSAYGYDLKGTYNQAAGKLGQGKMPKLAKDLGTEGFNAGFLDEWTKDTSEKWRTTFDMVAKDGKGFEHLKVAVEQFDKDIASELSTWITNNPNEFVDDNVVREIAANVEAKLKTSTDSLSQELYAAIQRAKDTVTAIRFSATKEQSVKLNEAGIEAGLPKEYFDKPTSAKIGPEARTATATKGSGILSMEESVAEQVSKDLTEAERIAETNSPSKRTERLGKDIGDGLVEGLQQKEAEVKSQADRLAEAGVPRRTAAETQARVSKMDLTNKAFYDDLNTPENRDIRQVLKSQDRQRRKRGVGKGNLPLIDDKKVKASTASIRVSTKNIEENTKVIDAATEETAQAHSEVAATVRDNRDINIKIKGNEINIADSTEDQAQTQDQINAAKQEQLAATENGNNVTNQTTTTMTDVREESQQTADILERTNEDLITQERLADAIAQTEQERATTLEQTQSLEQQTLQQKEKELAAATANAQQEMSDASNNMPPGLLTQSQALDEASDFARDENGQIVMGQDGPMSKKQYKQMKRGMRREKAQRFSGKASGALGMATVAAGVLGAPPQVTAALGGASMVAQFAPMLAGMGPIGWTVTALTALGAGAYMLNQHFNKMAAEAAKFVTATSATRESMKKMGQLTGKVGSSEIMDKRRQGSQYTKYNESLKINDTFGKKFLSDQYGQEELATFRKNIQQFNAEKATADLALKLAAQVADGVLTEPQAASIAHAMALQLGDQTLEMQIAGKVRTLVGPNGEKLEKEPLNTRINLIANARGRSEKIRQNIESGKYDQNQRKDIASLASYAMNNVELAQMQADAVALEHDEAKKKLETEIASTTNLQKKVKLESDLQTLLANQAKETTKMNNIILAQIYQAEQDFRRVQSNSVLGAQANREDAFFDASRTNVSEAYKGTEYENAAKKFLETTKGIGVTTYNDRRGSYDPTGFKNEADAQTFQAKMQMLVGSKVLNPEEANNWMRMFKGELNKLDVLINAGIRLQGAGKTKELFNLLSGFKNRALAKEIATDMILRKKDPAAFDASMEALNNLKSLDGLTIDMEVVLKTVGLEGVQKQMEDIEAFKKKLGKEKFADEKGGTAGLDQFGKENPQLSGAVEALKANQERMDQFRKLDAEGQTEYLQKLAAGIAYEANLNKDQFEADAAKWANIQLYMDERYKDLVIGSAQWEAARQNLIKEYKGKDAAARAVVNLDPVISANIPNKDGGATPPAGGTGSNPLDFLDALAMRIKNVRDGAFDATTPLKSMIAAFNTKKAQKDISKMFTMFDGLQQRLLKFKAPKEFRDMIYGMSSEDFSKLANLKGDKQLFTFAKGKPRTKANITGLTKSGKAVMQTYREADVGDYAFQQGDEALQNVKDQQTAYNMLTKSGMDAKDALKTIEDQAVASAIAAGALGKSGSAEMALFTKKIKEANDALEYQAVMTDLIAKNADFELYKRMPQLASSMTAMGLSADQMAAVLDNPELAKVLVEDLKDGKIDAKAISDYLNSIEEKKVIDIQIKMNQKDYAEAAAQGRDVVDQMFDIQERLIRTGADPRSTGMVDKMKANTKEIKAAETAARAFRKQIDDINEEISKMQREIEINYTRPIEDMTEKTNDLGRSLEVGGEYQIGNKKMTLDFKLSNRYMEQLNAESTKLSNDLTIIGHQSDQINEKYDKQVEALTKVNQINSEISKQQQNQLGLADALSQGDIAAAARAAQQSRADSISLAGDQAMAALEAGRKNELDALVGAESGLTKDQINERQYQIQQELYRIETSPERLAIKAEVLRLEDEIYRLGELREESLLRIRDKEDEIYKIQETQLKPLEKKIENLTYENQLLQDQIDALVEQITVLGMNKDEWERVKAKIDASALAAKDFSTALAGLLAAVQSINSAWDATLAKIQSYSSLTSGTTAPIVAQAEKIIETAKKDEADATAKIDAAKTLTDAKEYVAQLNAEAKKASGQNYTSDAQMDRALAAADSKYGTNLYGGTSRITPIVDEQTKLAGMRAAAASVTPKPTYTGFRINDRSTGGLIKYMAKGGLFRPINTDTVPAMLTPGEFIMSRYAVNSYGLDKMKAINNGDPVGDSVYNYSISVNVQSDANPDEIARVVMNQIRQVDSKRLRGAVI